MSEPQFRVWVGWRVPSLRNPGGWSRFLEALSKTFIPATWMVMRRYGLKSYVPSVTRPDLPHGCPEETALLVYESREAYEVSRTTVGGRSYGLMHGAVFEMPSPSRSAWAEQWTGAGPGRKLDAWVWPATGGARWSLADRSAQVVFVLVGHAANGRPAADVLYQSLNYADGQVVLCPTETFTAAWIATGEGVTPVVFGSALASRLTVAQVLVAHVARAVDTNGDYFEGPDGSVPVGDDETLRFIS
ncbi:MAG: hypothetical protein ING90_15325 [Rhodocyclaceae bacterium]|nr:hypothetical protein [Rhodocyclaceae bacterium]